MEICEYYHTRESMFDGKLEGVCYGTKECKNCSCGGNRKKCDFYSSIREFATKEKEDKEYLSPQEIINIVNEIAYSNKRKVPEEFYRRLLKV